MLRDMTQRPAEAALLRGALSATGKSQRATAAEVGLSEGRLRQILRGSVSVGGQEVPVVAPAETVARIAVHLGVAPDDMRDANRGDVADVMDMWANSPSRDRDSRADEATVWAELATWLAGRRGDPPGGALQWYSDVQLVQELADRLTGRLPTTLRERMTVSSEPSHEWVDWARSEDGKRKLRAMIADEPDLLNELPATLRSDFEN